MFKVGDGVGGTEEYIDEQLTAQCINASMHV